jgi:hypothetical protein
MKLPRPIHHISMEMPHKELLVRKHHFALTILLVLDKVALVVNPVLLDEIKVFVVVEFVE